MSRESLISIKNNYLLVEEEDDGGVPEPLVVADGVEQLQALLHPVLNNRRVNN